jgi:hypothetical protein
MRPLGGPAGCSALGSAPAASSPPRLPTPAAAPFPRPRCLPQLMLAGVPAGDHFEGTLEDPELLMEVGTTRRDSTGCVGTSRGGAAA